MTSGARPIEGIEQFRGTILERPTAVVIPAEELERRRRAKAAAMGIRPWK